VFALACVVASGCSPRYVLRAGYEEAKILWRREPIERVLAHADLEPAVRHKLETVVAARRFAADLGLRVGGSFASLSYVDGDSTLYVLTAAKRTALEPYTWWFPIVGRVPYKGFFVRAHAEAEAAALEACGYDTTIRSAAAFSTLGWFDDPLLRHLLRHDEGFLVNLVLHEVYHNTFYLGGAHATAFNESLATFVGHRGAITFFAAEPASGDLAHRAEAEWEDARRFGAFIERLAVRLRQAYAAAPDESAALAARAEIFAAARGELTSLPFATEEFSYSLAEPLNNAVLLHHLLYASGLDLFEEIYHEQGDLRRTLSFVERAARAAPADPFTAVRRALAAVSPDARPPAPSGAAVDAVGVPARCRSGLEIRQVAQRHTAAECPQPGRAGGDGREPERNRGALDTTHWRRRHAVPEEA
jgi:predicted aminopeptidase